MVRYPLEERRSLAGLEQLRVRTQDGAEVPLATVASISPQRALAAIHRNDRMRVINIAGDVDRGITTPGRASAQLEAKLPELLRDLPGIGYRFEGAQQEDSEASAGLMSSFSLALLGIYALLAVPLRSYAQPLIIMSVIPFGSLGAILGHLVMGHTITFFSLVGMVALAGVVVNASLMLVHFSNRLFDDQPDTSMPRLEALERAIVTASQTRFRPILLTSLTTFAGLLPLILERSVPLQTMVPMAVSLGFGVLLSTVFTLLLVPCELMLIEDLRQALARRLGTTSTLPTQQG
jgi:multidrug efflux pump subunit AcrB